MEKRIAQATTRLLALVRWIKELADAGLQEPGASPRPFCRELVQVFAQVADPPPGGFPASSMNHSKRVIHEVRTVVSWYFGTIYARLEGPRVLPFYCDPERIGAFAVAPANLAAGSETAVFRLFVTLSMYQALRDVVIMRQQQSLPRAAMRVVAAAAFVKRSIAGHQCPLLRSVDALEEGCDVSKVGEVVDCGTYPGTACHVKEATIVFNRMGDMGKLPTSAWLRLWKTGGVREVLAAVCRAEASPTKRASLLVERFARVHRVGRKLATMFVSALSTPALAPGLTPWFPDIDGNELVVVDTNVARAVDALREPGAPKSYDAREHWVREQAAMFDLREFRPDLPLYSPRLVQQALYAFCSKSNRVARGDACSTRATPCPGCAPAICPFAPATEGADALAGQTCGSVPEKRARC